MNAKIKIRAYSIADYCAILELLKLNTPHFFSEEEERDLIYYLENEIEYYFVVEHDKKIIGCGGINFTDNKKTGKISWDIMHPIYQGKGIGTLLLHHRIEILKSIQSIETILVRTSQHVFEFYQKNGFELIEIKKDFWAKGFDLYSMKYKGLKSCF